MQLKGWGFKLGGGQEGELQGLTLVVVVGGGAVVVGGLTPRGGRVPL